MTAGDEALEIRLVERAEAAELASWWSRWRTGGDADVQFADRMRRWIDGEGDRRTIWTAVLDGSPVGLTSLFEYRRMPSPGRPDACWGYVGNMFVERTFRNRGIGSALLRAVTDAAEQRGYVRLVLSPSPQSVPFYLRAGFVAPDVSGDQRLLVLAFDRE